MDEKAASDEDEVDEVDEADEVEDDAVPQPVVKSISGPIIEAAKRGGVSGWLALGVAVVIAIVLVVVAQGMRRDAEDQAQAQAKAAMDDQPEVPSVAADAVFDSGELTGPGDAAPRLVEGPPALAPRAAALMPSVVVRVRVDASGGVAEAKIFRARPDQQDFEQAALATVAHYRFEPAKKGGTAVSAWLNLPVGFEAVDPRGRRLLRIEGSDTIGGELGPALARALGERDRRVVVEVEASGSSDGIEALLAGDAEIAAASRSIAQDELAAARRAGVELREFVIGYDGIAVIVHPQNPVTELDALALAGMFGGAVDDWSGTGGGSGAIAVVSRSPGSGTHGFFLDKVLRSDRGGKAHFADDTRFVEHSRELVELVAGDPLAIGYVGVGWVDDSVKAVAVAPGPGKQAVAPTAESIGSGRYPIYRPLLLYTRARPSAAVIGFLRLALGPDGQRMLAEHGFVPVGAQAPESLPQLASASADGPAAYLTRITYATARTEVPSDQRPQLAALAEAVAGDGGSRVVIVSHPGPDTAEVARARAEAVRTDLLGRKLDAGRVELREPSSKLAERAVDVRVYVRE